jgi:NUMOD1 domain
MSLAHLTRDKAGYAKTIEHRSKISKTLGHMVEVTDVTDNKTTVFDTIGEAALFLGSSHTSISRYIRNQKMYKGRYQIIKKDKPE